MVLTSKFYQENLNKYSLDGLLTMQFSSRAYGFLCREWEILKYVSLEDGEFYELGSISGPPIKAICTDGEEVYFSGKTSISSLFRGSRLTQRDIYVWVRSIEEHRGRILGAGKCGLVNTLENEVLISEEEMKKRNIENIDSLLKDEEENLYALVRYTDKSHGVITLPESSRKYSLGKEILHYEVKHDDYCQAIIIPGILKRNNEIWLFSIISSANLKFLDLNGEEIKGTKVGKDQYINGGLDLLSIKKGKVEVIYSGDGLGTVKAEIDIKRREAKTETLPYSCRLPRSVFHKELHEKLIKKSIHYYISRAKEKLKDGEYYDSAGDYIEAALFFEQAGLMKEAKKTWEKAGDAMLKHMGRAYSYKFVIKCYKNAGLKEEVIYAIIGNYALRSEDYLTAIRYFEKAGFSSGGRKERKKVAYALKEYSREMRRSGFRKAAWKAMELREKVMKKEKVENIYELLVYLR